MLKSVFFLTALGAFTLIAVPASAGTVDLPYLTQDQLKATCDREGGTFSPASGPNTTHDCLGKGGGVSCTTNPPKCIGSCSNCGQVSVGGGTSLGGIKGVLTNALEPAPGVVFPTKPALLQVKPTFSTQGQTTTAP